MRRAPELKTLSEDHHHGLVQARRLRGAGVGDDAPPVGDAAASFLDFWQRDTSLHFRKEEEVLLPVVARNGGDVSSENATTMLVEHARIRGLVMQLSDEVEGAGARPETLHELGALLEAHIRFEERVLFPSLEESLGEEALEELAARLETKEEGPRAEPWVPALEVSYAPWPGPGDSEGGGYDY